MKRNKKSRSPLCPGTAPGSQICRHFSWRELSEVNYTQIRALNPSFVTLVCDEAANKFQLDKEVATEVKRLIAADADLGDEKAGWHVISGKSFAAAVSYNTKFVAFFDLPTTGKSFMLFKTQ